MIPILTLVSPYLRLPNGLPLFRKAVKGAVPRASSISLSTAQLLRAPQSVGVPSVPPSKRPKLTRIFRVRVKTPETCIRLIE